MKTNAFLVSLMLLAAASVQAETLVCAQHPKFAEGRQFRATVEVSGRGSALQARLVNLKLSEPWPLPQACDNPAHQRALVGRAEGGEITLSPKGARACSYVLYVPATSNEPALLSPRKSAKVFGEAPFMASCQPR